MERPIPLTDPARPPFPTETLPRWLRAFVEALARSLQVPVDLPAMFALAVLATACAHRVVVQVGASWREPVNLYVAVVLPPANRKSAVVPALTAVLVTWEAEQTRCLAPAIAEAQNRLKINEGALAHAQQAAARAKPEERASLLAEADRLAREQECQTVPAAPRLVVDDVSPERLASLLIQQGGRLAVLSAEGGIFDQMAGRYSSGTPNLGVFLQVHAGDTLRVDRVGRPSEFVDAPALTIGVTVQPEVLHGLARKPGFRGLGLLARFLFIVADSIVGRRDPNPPPMAQDLADIYNGHVRALLELEPATDEHGEPVPHVLHLSAAAESALAAFAAAVEPRLGEFGDLGSIPDWGGKLVGTVVRIAGLLHMAEHAGDLAPWEIPLSGESTANAITIGEYLTAHAHPAFAAMGADPVVEDARYVLRWIERQRVTSFSKRDLYQAARGRFKRVEDLDPALALLVAHHYLAPRPSEAPTGPGRRPSPVFDVNPLALSTTAQDAAPTEPEFVF